MKQLPLTLVIKVVSGTDKLTTKF